MRVLIFRNTSFCKRFRVGGQKWCVSYEKAGNEEASLAPLGAILKVREMTVHELINELLEQNMDSEVQMSVEVGENTYTVDIGDVDKTPAFSSCSKYVYLNGTAGE